MGPESKPEPGPDPSDARRKTPSGDTRGGTSVPSSVFCCPQCASSIQINPNASGPVSCPECGFVIDADAGRHGTTVAQVRTVGRFQLLARIGQGGFGNVWRARDTELGRPVAIKFLHSSLHSSTTARERFRREAIAVAQLRHPGIASLHEAVELEGTPALVYEFIDGLTLAERMQGRRITCREAAALVAGVADGLEYAHEMKVIHRDVKPGNIMLEEGHDSSGSGVTSGTSGISSPLGRAVLVDFGLAIREEMESTLTQEGQALGTPAYMSPEQAAGKIREVDRRSDIYGLGVVLYEIICRQRPFEGSKRVILHHVIHDEPERPRRIDRTIPRDLENVCLKAMAKEPGRRYHTSRAMAEDLRRFLLDEPVKARRAGLAERAWRWCRRNPAVAALTTAVALSLVVGTSVATYFAIRADAGEKAALNFAAEAEREKKAALEARNAAVLAKALSDRRRYAAELNNAHQSWKAGQVPFLDDILDSQEESLRGPEWHLLKRFCHLDLRTLRGHKGAVRAVAISPDTRYIASAGADGTIRIWSMASGEALHSLSGLGGEPVGVAYSPDGQLLASALPAAKDANGAGYIVKVWETATWREVHSLPRPETIRGMVFAPRGRVIALAVGIQQSGGGGRGEVDLWDLDHDKEPRKFAEATAPVEGISFSPDGKLLATAAPLNLTIDLWETASRRHVRTLRGHEAPVMAVCFAPDSRHVASAGWDSTARVWDANDVDPTVVLSGHAGPALCASFSPDGRWLATTSWDETVKLWDVETATCLATWRGHTAPVRGVVFSPDGWRVVSASEDGTIKVWGATADAEVAVATALSPDSRAQNNIDSLDFDPTGRRLASAGPARCLRIWNLKTGQQAFVLRAHREHITSVAYDPTGRKVASGGGDRSVRVFDVSGGKELWSRIEHAGPVTSVAYSPDGLFVASSSRDQTIRIWEAASGTHVRTISDHAGAVNKIVFSPDGKSLLSTTGDSLRSAGIKRWNVSTGEEQTIYRQNSGAGALAISPDGRWVAWGGNDKTIRIADANVPGEPRILRGHTQDVTGLAFGPAGQRLVSAGKDGALRIWDPGTGQLIMTLAASGELHSAAISVDGRWIGAGNEYGDIMLWDAEPSGPAVNERRETLGLVRSLYAQRLTPDEVAARIRNDKSIGEALRSSAADLSSVYFREVITGRADEVVRDKADKLFLKARVLESIRTDTGLDEVLRKEALGAAEQFVEWPTQVRRVAWRIVCVRRAPAADRKRALELTEAVIRLVPDGGPYLSALGAAQYRNGMLAKAVETLTKADRVNTNVSGGPEASDLAFLAMARFRLGQEQEARKTLERLRSLMQKPEWARKSEARGFLQEAEEVVGRK